MSFDGSQNQIKTGIKNTYNQYRTQYLLPKIKQTYHRLPEGIKSTARESYYFVNPRRSWMQLKEKQRAYDHFVDRFFETEKEYQAYKDEFLETDIYNICMSSRKEVDPPHYFFDAHLNTCVNYYSLIRKYEPKVLLETGVYNGVATLSMLLALQKNGTGRLYSIDNSKNIDNPRETDVRGDGGAVNRDRFYSRRGQSCGDSAIVPENKGPGWIIPDELENEWVLTEGDSRDVLPGVLEELGEIDFFVHDSEHSNARMFFEFELVWNHLSQAGIMLSGHVAQNDAFETFAEERSCDHGFYDVLWDPEPHPDSCYSSRKPCRSGYLTKGEAKPT